MQACLFFSCPKCNGVFCGEYAIELVSPNDDLEEPQNPYYSLVCESFVPKLVDHIHLDISVAQKFQRATTLFRQAETAEQNDIVELAGMGYRKALECLIKDTLVYIGVKTKEQVSSMHLTDAIQAFKEDAPSVYIAANKARAIGNDYVHYEAKYTGYDIKELKGLLRITFHWIEMLLATRDIAELQKKGNSSASACNS